MTGLNEFKEWIYMERKSIEHTIPFWYGDYNYEMVRYEKARLDELNRVEKELERCQKGENK